MTATAQRPRTRIGVAAWLEAHALFIAAVSAVVVISLIGIPVHLAQDGWLALVAGRIIAQHGIPHHDYLTVMAHGVRWVDQQWLAQLSMYGLQQLGGLALLCVFYVGLTGVAFAMAIAASRSLGGEDRHVTAMLPLGAFFYLATAVSIRTQGFAYPLFVATLWLLAAEARRPSPAHGASHARYARVYLVFPMLVIWANLHGSATLGVGMAVIYGATLLYQGFRAERWHGLLHRRGLIFLIGSPLTLFVTPYGLSAVHYYRATLFNPEFGKLVSEWQPVTAFTILAVPLLLLIFGTVWALGRSGRRTPLFDQLVLAVLALGAIDAVRNITWFGLAIVILLPSTISQLMARKPAAPRRTRLNLTLAVGCIAVVILGGVATLTRPASWFESTYPTRALPTIRSILARDPSAKIFADVHYADWLVWHDPALAGHIAYDTSFENLTTKQLVALNSLTEAVVPGIPDTVAPYSVLMLDPSNKTENKILLDRRGAKVVLRSKRVIIATKPAT